MVADIRIDASDVEQLARAIRNLPGDIKTKAMVRAMRRMRDMARTRVVKRNAKHVKIPQKVIRELTTAHFNAGGNTIEVIEKSGWIPLYDLRHRSTKRGVLVSGRGSYRHAWVGKVYAGKNRVEHLGIWRREPGSRMQSNPKKEKIREMFGPNPAHAITNNPEEYLEVMAELIQEHLAPRFMHELDRILPR
ncbi:hypothetical protein [uncultured Martelella sp.]|uniref:hypothetical protein n=1 Tax=uncultured Martelella sp. TaxID=392331 RepID=UPI0029C73012|nr:hypothetical protein [uncultured Martelella sp.]